LKDTEVRISNTDALAARVRSGNDLHAADRNLQRVGQQTAAGDVGLAFYGWGTHRYLQEAVADSDDLIPPGPGLDENGKEEIIPPGVKI
jgi:hypothetical protein